MEVFIERLDEKNFAEKSDFASYKYLAHQSNVFGSNIENAVGEAIRAFHDEELISAGNQFLDICQITRNEEQYILANLSMDNLCPNDLQIRRLRYLECYLIRDAALSFTFAFGRIFKGIERKTDATWPKLGSAVSYGKVPYGEGRSVSEMLKDIKCPLDTLLDGSTSAREVARRLSYYCRVLVRALDGDGEYLPATECIIAISLPSKGRDGLLKSALISARDEEGKATNESRWINECVYLFGSA